MSITTTAQSTQGIDPTGASVRVMAMDDAVWAQQYHAHTAAAAAADASLNPDMGGAHGALALQVQGSSRAAREAAIAAAVAPQVSALESGDMTDEQIAYRLERGLEVPQDILDAQAARKAAAGQDVGAAGDAGSAAPAAASGGSGSRKVLSPAECHSTFHGRAETDYQGRCWTTPPRGRRALEPDQLREHVNYLPKKQLHSFKGHNKGVNSVHFAPGTGHLLLTADMAGVVKVWDMQGKRTCKRTYKGHTLGVRQARFRPDGKRFVTVSFDTSVKVWDTASGACLHSLTPGGTPQCVAWHPTEKDSFIVGSSNRRMYQVDAASGGVVQEYDYHLSGVNTITFTDGGEHMVSTSDDKKMLVWDWGIPVPIKYISSPDMHSMPAASLSPSGRFMALQCLDNVVRIYTAAGKVRLNPKKKFSGHVVAGYACQVGFAPSGAFVISGDSDGKLWIWDWRNGRMARTFNAHRSGPCIGAEWHPLDESHIVTCGWDGQVLLWG